MSTNKLNKESFFTFITFISMQHSQSGPNWWPRVLRGAGDAKQGSVEDKMANQVNEALKRKTNTIQFSKKKIIAL